MGRDSARSTKVPSRLAAHALDGRTRRQIEAMRRVQAVALDLFEARGFAAVTVEQIAAAAGIGAATVYRHFKVKERLVLWDEYDPLLLDAIAAAVHTGLSPMMAIRTGLLTSLAGVYRRDKARILRRASLAGATPSIEACVASDLKQLRVGLAATLRPALPGALARAVIAAAATGALEAALEAWVSGGGRVPLERLLRKAFETLGAGGTG